MGIVEKNEIQENLFAPKPNESSKKISQLMDKINAKFGKETVKFAIQGTNNVWKGNASKIDLKYTTLWKDLLQVISLNENLLQSPQNFLLNFKGIIGRNIKIHRYSIVKLRFITEWVCSDIHTDSTSKRLLKTQFFSTFIGKSCYGFF